MKANTNTTTKLDRAAILLSGLCLLHCLAIPFALLLGPLVGQWLSTTETQVHWVLLALAAPLSMLALMRGYTRHRSTFTLALGGTGLALMLAGVGHLFGDRHEILLTVGGVTLLMVAHIRNLMGAHRHSTDPAT